MRHRGLLASYPVATLRKSQAQLACKTTLAHPDAPGRSARIIKRSGAMKKKFGACGGPTRVKKPFLSFSMHSVSLLAFYCVWPLQKKNRRLRRANPFKMTQSLASYSEPSQSAQSAQTEMAQNKTGGRDDKNLRCLRRHNLCTALTSLRRANRYLRKL